MSTSTPEAAVPCGGFQEGEVPVVDPAERWFRACNADLVDEETGEPTNLMFGLSSSDGGKLSGTLASKTSPAETRAHLSDVLHRSIAQMREVTVGTLASAELHLHDDSANFAPPEAPPGHAYLDLQHLPPGKQNPAKRARERVRAWLLENSKLAS